MNSQNYGRGSWFVYGGRSRGWLLPLAIAIGVLMFTLLPAIGHAFDHQPRAAYRAGADAPGDRQQAGPRADGGAPGTSASSRPGRTPERRHYPFGLSWLSSLFFPFAWFRLVASALLIGTGAWMLTSRRHGPGGPGGPSVPQSGQAPTAPSPAERIEPQPSNDPEPPATGGTRYL